MDGNFIKAFLTLTGSVIAIGLFFFYLKKYSNRFRSKSQAVDLQIVSKINLQPKTSIYIIKAGGKTLLIGANDHDISTLADLTPEVAGQAHRQINDAELTGKINKLTGNLKGKAATENTDPLSFRAFIRSSLGKSN